MKILIKVFILMLLFISCKVKAEEKINYLESLTIENYNINFKKNVYEYDITIDDEDMLNINYELSDDNAYISIEGNGNFNKSNNIILINVNNDYKYKINVHKTLKVSDVKEINVVDEISDFNKNLLKLVIITISSSIITYLIYILFYKK